MHSTFFSCALFLQKTEICHTKVFRSLCLCDNTGNSLNLLNYSVNASLDPILRITVDFEVAIVGTPYTGRRDLKLSELDIMLTFI